MVVDLICTGLSQVFSCLNQPLFSQFNLQLRNCVAIQFLLRFINFVKRVSIPIIKSDPAIIFLIFITIPIHVHMVKPDPAFIFIIFNTTAIDNSVVVFEVWWTWIQ